MGSRPLHPPDGGAWFVKAAAGLPGVALAGAAIGGEQGLQEAQAAGADVPETVLGALGQAFIGAASAYGPAGAVAKFGIPEASRGLLLEALQGAAVGAGQSLGSDVVAKATYDPERAVDVGRAVNAALEMGIVSGGTHGSVLPSGGTSSHLPQSGPGVFTSILLAGALLGFLTMRRLQMKHA